MHDITRRRRPYHMIAGIAKLNLLLRFNRLCDSILIGLAILCCCVSNTTYLKGVDAAFHPASYHRSKFLMNDISLAFETNVRNRAQFSSKPNVLMSIPSAALWQHRNIQGTPPRSLKFQLTGTSQQSSMALPMSSVSDITPSSTQRTRATAVYLLMLLNLGVFLADKVFRYPFVTKQLYFFHQKWKWWQPLTTCFCHADRGHLTNNLFLLLLFGRSVEDDMGWGGLFLSYIFCGVLASLVSLLLLPSYTVSIGASGAVFGLFAVSTLAKFSVKELIVDWRKLVEVAVLGDFVFRQLTSEISTAAKGGISGINHVAHLSGAAAGVIMVYVMRATVTSFEKAERIKLEKKSKDK